MTNATKPFLFDVADCGCYADGSFGYPHMRSVLASLLGRLQQDTAELIESLEGPPPDDIADEYEAMDYLQGFTSPLLLWMFEGGDLVLVRAEDIA